MVHNRRHIKIKTNEEWYYWLGFYLGDGYSYLNEDKGKGTVNFFLSLKDDYLRCHDYFSSLGLNPRMSCPLSKKMVAVTITSMSLTLAFRQYYPGHQVATTKKIPAQVWSACLPLRNSFLQGVLDSDGYISNSSNIGTSVHLANLPLIKELYLLFHDSGIPGTIVITSSNSWRLQLHRWYVLKYLDRGTGGVNCLPRHNKVIPRLLQEQAVKDFAQISDIETVDKAVMYRLRAGKSVSVYTLQYLYDKYEIVPVLPVYDYFYLESTSTSDTVEDTYTLAVHSPLHRFDAETIINKNTSADIQKLAMAMMYEQLHALGYSPTQSHDMRQICTIHDEIVSEALPRLAEQCAAIQESCMVGAAKFILEHCPIEAEVHPIANLAMK